MKLSIQFIVVFLMTLSVSLETFGDRRPVLCDTPTECYEMGVTEGQQSCGQYGSGRRNSVASHQQLDFTQKGDWLCSVNDFHFNVRSNHKDTYVGDSGTGYENISSAYNACITGVYLRLGIDNYGSWQKTPLEQQGRFRREANQSCPNPDDVRAYSCFLK